MSDGSAQYSDPRAPVASDGSSASTGPEEGIALCLSGGGYRAMLFHVGAVWRLHEVGVLADVKRVSSVSGGSITAAALALKWKTLTSSGWDRGLFEKEFVVPVRELASTTIDIPAILAGCLLPGSIGDYVARSYRKSLYGQATLQDLPDTPVFVINATNMQSGVLWRFTKRYMRDYRVGEVKFPGLSLSTAVAASSAFPPFLSPVELRLDPNSFTDRSGDDLQYEPYTKKVVLSDGGVYDNLGLETAWKRFKTVLVSDGGGKMADQPRPKRDWARHSRRMLDVIDNQVRDLRKRQLLASYTALETDAVHRTGSYWGIRSDIAKFGLADSLRCPKGQTLSLANISTRLARLAPLQQERLINWGYAVCDASIRAHFDKTLSPPTSFPYPDSAV